MVAKTFTVSARIPKEDADFLAEVQIQGATTASDKVRALIAEARRRRRGFEDFPSALSAMQDLFAPVAARVRQVELREEMHSELLIRALEWLPEMAAYLVSSAGALEGGGGDALRQAEAGVAERAFRMFEALLQLGVTQRCPCYESDAIQRRIAPILELAQVIESRRS